MPRLLQALAALLLACPLQAQDRGAAALGERLSGLGTTARVLMIGAHPDDEDTQLIAWLVRGRHVETAYLSLTRGDGGQNLVGNELGEALGAIRTQELLAARRVDGGRQYFTRAYDFGFTKTAEETYTHWPHDEVLTDVVTVVRAFRPHVIVAVFSGTPRDGHGQHQVSGLLAREAYDVAGDGARFPASATAGLAPWTPAKFYRAARFAPQSATLSFNVGEHDPLLGRSYLEIAGESRSQHKSQGFGVLQRKGASLDHVRREATRVNAAIEAASERSMFDGIDTTWARLRPLVRDAAARAAIDSLPAAIAAARGTDLYQPDGAVPALARVKALLQRAWCGRGNGCVTDGIDPVPARDFVVQPDVERSLVDGWRRVDEAILLASGAAVEANADRETVALGDSARVEVVVYARSRVPLRVSGLFQTGDEARATAVRLEPSVPIAPDSARRWPVWIDARQISQPWWLARPRAGDMFSVPIDGRSEQDRDRGARFEVGLEIGPARVWAPAPVRRRLADPVKGDVSRPLAVVPVVSVTLDRAVELAPADERLARPHGATLAAAGAPREVAVSLRLPTGLAADSAARRTQLPGGGEPRTVTFHVTGRLPAGEHRVTALARSGSETFTTGAQVVAYDHITPQRLYRDAVVALRAVDVTIPRNLAVAYIPGVGDNVAPMLEQLGIRVTVVDPGTLAATDLSRFSAVVVGPRAYESSAVLVANNGRLLDYVRNGGTLVVQYGQYEMTQPGIMPYPITIGRPHDRVTVETAPVRVIAPGSPLLAVPNRIGQADFAGWVQERSLYMPRTFDARYTPVLSMNDPDEPPNEGAILVAPVGRGTYVYTTLALFRQLPAGVPGGARLFVNLLSAGQNGDAIPAAGSSSVPDEGGGR